VTSGIVATADILTDTDVIIDHLRGRRPLPAVAVAYSAVTRAELFAGKRGEEDRIRSVLSPFQELVVDREVAEVAGRVRRETDLSLPDGLIAATAIVHNVTLMTRNLRHFQRVDGLRLVWP
jgi:tRNA(fMet)-specific endonuclease VapC